MDNILLSIIVPVYNVERYLRRCLESIINQTYSNLEIILVDDGSTDNSGNICDEFAEKDSRITVIHKKNEGVSVARNIGLDIAKGDYIGLVDSDDYIKVDMYKKLLELITASDSDMAVCNFSYVDENGNLLEERNLSSPIKDEYLDVDRYIKRWHGDRGWYYVTPVNRLYKKRVFDDLRYPVGIRFEDEFIMHHLVYRCSHIICTKECLYFYVQRSDSFMRKKENFSLMDYGDALIDRYYFAKEKGDNYLKQVTLKQLMYELDRWNNFAYEDKLCRKRFSEIRRKSMFLLREKSAWTQYSWRGRAVRKIQLFFPGIARCFFKSVNRNKD